MPVEPISSDLIFPVLSLAGYSSGTLRCAFCRVVDAALQPHVLLFRRSAGGGLSGPSARSIGSVAAPV
jgi:hypothetical protein